MIGDWWYVDTMIRWYDDTTIEADVVEADFVEADVVEADVVDADAVDTTGGAPGADAQVSIPRRRLSDFNLTLTDQGMPPGAEYIYNLNTVSGSLSVLEWSAMEMNVVKAMCVINANDVASTRALRTQPRWWGERKR